MYMTEKNEVDLNLYVKKQTFYTMFVLALFAGFIGGTIYSSFKLARPATGMVQNQTGPGMQAQDPQDHSAEFAAQMMKVELHLKKNPDDAAAWAQLGHLFFDSNQPANAINAYKKSLAIAPGHTGVMTDLGVMYRRNNQPEKAIEMFDQVIEVDPDFEQARFNKGIVLLHDLNDFEGGIKAWEELLEVNPMAVTSSGETLKSLIQKMKQNK
jgi:cytochrome c-type biogenesis protein CcmH/NrfG